MAVKVLVCDDEPSLRLLVRATLDGRGYEIHEAASGDEALALARELEPDVVLLDRRIPGPGGFDVLRELRADHRLTHLRVVMLTASAQASDRQEALSLGADQFVAKPFHPADLADVVANLVEAPA